MTRIDEVDQELGVVIGTEDFFTMDHILTVFPVLRAIVSAGAFSVPRLNPEAVSIKTVTVWLIGMFLEIPQVPFARDRSGIACLLKKMTKGFQVNRQPVGFIDIRLTIKALKESASIRIEPRHDHGTGRCTNGRGIGIVEECTFSRHAIEMRCGVNGVTITGEIFRTKIVGHNEHDVGWLSFGCTANTKAEETQKEWSEFHRLFLLM